MCISMLNPHKDITNFLNNGESITHASVRYYLSHNACGDNNFFHIKNNDLIYFDLNNQFLKFIRGEDGKFIYAGVSNIDEMYQ